MQLKLDDISDLGQRFCVAVSGGADSLALCLLAQKWAEENGHTLVALSVDHGLRSEAAAECQWVHETLAHYGIEHHTLIWTGDKPARAIQAAAREARYDLMGGWCKTQGIKDLLLAHHQDDQGETFLMRLARGSGVDGLSAMQKVTHRGALRLVRPLLDVPKAALKKYLQDKNQDWIEDPSNQNEAFDRVKMRNAMSSIEDVGLTPERLAQTALSMQRVRKTLEHFCHQWLSEYARLFEEGYVTLASNALLDENEEIVLRGLSRIGQVVGGDIYPPRLEKLCRLHKTLSSGQDATLMGCRWMVTGTEVLVCREIREKDVPENLYDLDCATALADMEMRVLGEDGWADVLAHAPEIDRRGLPMAVIYALVSFWDKQGVSAVPHLGYKRADVIFDAKLRFIPNLDRFS